MILLPRHQIHTSAEHKRCMLEFVKTAAHFSVGCAGKRIGLSLFATLPHYRAIRELLGGALQCGNL
jgi:hypothetical protein